jgi:hypothetical protein
MTNVFANRSNEEEIYPLTAKEIAEAQELDRHFKASALKEKYESTLIENTLVFCKNGKLVIPRSHQHHAVSWETHALKRQLKLQCTGNICVPLYAHTSKTVDLAR